MNAFAPNSAQVEALTAFRTGESLRITAAAGAGKTSTLEYLAANSLDKRILYIAFNKSVQVEASERFPRNVTARTAHSLAYAAFGRPLQHRLRNAPRLSPQQQARILGVHGPTVVQPQVEDAAGLVTQAGITFSPSVMASLAMATTRRFMRSDADKVEPVHFIAPDGTEHAVGLPALRNRVVELAQTAWEDVSSTDGMLRCEHDVYLKLWAMSRPVLRFDVIFIDEAQDTDPLLASVIRHQMELGTAQIIVVGDEAQAIYGWRGATDFISRFPAKHTVELNQSWRFGRAVADEANVWLGHVGVRMRVVGDPAKAATTTVGPLTDPDAILCRSNAGALSAVMECISHRRPVALVGGASDLERFVQSAQALQSGRSTTHPDLVAFSSWPTVVAYADTEEGADLAVWCKLIERHGTSALLAAIASTVPEDRADVVVSTAHKAKGRQWPSVQIWDDFREPHVDKETGIREPISREEAMLAYVAVTRAERVLDNSGLSWIHSPEHDIARTSVASAAVVHTPALPEAQPKTTATPHRVRVRPTVTPPALAVEMQAPGLTM